jgi:hypothetical protein
VTAGSGLPRLEFDVIEAIWQQRQSHALLKTTGVHKTRIVLLTNGVEVSL